MGNSSEQKDSFRRGFVFPIAWGIAGATILMIALLRVNPDIGNVLQSLKFWEKFGFVGSVAVTSLVAVFRFSQPGARSGLVPVALMVPILAMWILAIRDLVDAEPAQRAVLFFGETWAVCPLLIAMLSIPVFAAVIWTMRDRAPTRLRLSGAVAGLFSGATGALVYCFHCPEIEPPFIAFWYLLGMLIPAAAGAIIGRRVLRW